MRSKANIAVMAALTVSVVAVNARAEDRYGPPRAADPEDIAPIATLNWPGKPQPVAAPAAAVQSAPAWAQRQAAPQALPTSIYAPARAAYRPASTPSAQTAAASVQPMVARTSGEPPRYYSVHRQYGLQPDPITLSPQFLANSSSADLAEPPPLPPPHYNSAQTANMSAAAATSQARAAQQAEQAGDTGAIN